MRSLHPRDSITFVDHIIIMCLVPNQSIPRLKKSRDKIWLFLSDTIAKKAIASRLEHFLSCTKKRIRLNDPSLVPKTWYERAAFSGVQGEPGTKVCSGVQGEPGTKGSVVYHSFQVRHS